MSSLWRSAGAALESRSVPPEDPPSEPFLPRPITTTSAAQQIAEQIRAAILRGQLPPGHRLPSESDLAAEYAVSRGTIRETMKLLSATQLVEATRGAGGGTFVRLPEPDSAAAAMSDTLSLWFNAGSTSLGEVNAAREWIERGCLKMAVRNAQDDDLAAIRDAVEAMEAPGIGMDDMLALDIDFHVAISRAAHNAVLELAMNAVHLVRPYSNTMLVPLLRIATIAEQHRAIYEAISARDEPAAERAFEAHMAHLGDVLEQALADQRAEDVSLGTLTSEAHPEVERIRSRVMSRRKPAPR
jgi:GntR family transcriptional regulator, transcriptional repressor for pyruvate dehydrogenase complex